MWLMVASPVWRLISFWTLSWLHDIWTFFGWFSTIVSWFLIAACCLNLLVLGCAHNMLTRHHRPVLSTAHSIYACIDSIILQRYNFDPHFCCLFSYMLYRLRGEIGLHWTSHARRNFRWYLLVVYMDYVHILVCPGHWQIKEIKLGQLNLVIVRARAGWLNKTNEKQNRNQKFSMWCLN